MEVLQSNNGNTLILPKDLNFSHAHPKDQTLGNPLLGVKTKASFNNICNTWLFFLKLNQKILMKWKMIKFRFLQCKKS